jgi:hypothetical protein
MHDDAADRRPGDGAAESGVDAAVESGTDASSGSGGDAKEDAPMVVAFYGIGNPLPVDGGNG